MSIEEVRQQAQAEKLTLLVAESKTGYYGVLHSQPGRPRPYQAQVRCGGKKVHLGYFATAEEAALCVARSPEGQAVAAKRAAAAVPLTSEEVRQQAQAEGLTLHVAESKTGYFGVSLDKPGKLKPYLTRVRRGGTRVSLGSFATAEEAALCFARSPEGLAAAAGRAAAAVPLWSEKARQQAQAEGLTLRLAENQAGYFGVYLDKRPGLLRPYEAQVRRGGKQVSMGSFATAEEAALCVARSPEGQAAAGRAAAAVSQGTLPAVPSGAFPREKGTTPAIAPGAEPVVKVEDLFQLLDDDLEAALPSGAILKEEGTAPPLPPGTFVTEEVVVKEEEGSDCLPKRQRMK